MKRLLSILCVVNLTIGEQNYADPQTMMPMPYEFGYGVNDHATGDVKEHYETTLENGRTVGEYRLLQENGLFRVVKYFVDGDSGFQAAVTEEKGEEVTNYAFNSLNGDSKATFRARPNLRNDNMLSETKLDAAASINLSYKSKVDSSEVKDVDYEFLENRQPFDPQKNPTNRGISIDEIRDVSVRIESNEGTYERSHRGANHRVTDSEAFDNDENLTIEEYFGEEFDELSTPKANFESTTILSSPLCEPFSGSSSRKGCNSKSPKASADIRPFKATKLFNNPQKVNTVNNGDAEQPSHYSTEASESHNHLTAISPPKENTQTDSTPFFHNLPKPLEHVRDDKLLEGSRSSSSSEAAHTQVPSTIVKLDNGNGRETGIVTPIKIPNSFLHHQSFSPNSNKIFRTFINSPTIKVNEHRTGILSNVNTAENKQSSSLNFIQNKNRSNTASTEVKNHSLNSQKNKNLTKQLSILNSKGEKVFLPHIPFDQIRQIIVVDGKGSAPRVLLDSNKVAQKSKGPNLKSFKPVMFFQNERGILSSLNKKFNEKFTGLSPKPTAPSFESLRSQRNLETFKILADVKNDNHVRKTRQQIIENVLKNMNKNEAKSPDIKESLSRGRFYPPMTNFYSH